MKSLSFLPLLLGIALCVHQTKAQWVGINAPGGSDVRCSAVSGTNLFAGTGDGVSLSAKNGIQWSAANLSVAPEGGQEMPGGTLAQRKGKQARQAERLGVELGYAVNELRIGFSGIEITQRSFRLVGPAISFATLIHDPYNGDRPATTLSGVGTLGLIVCASFFHSEDVGENAASVLRTVILLPALLANSELHAVLISPDSISDPGIRTLSIYAATRTDVFLPWKSGANAWVRFSPALGLSLQTQESLRGPSSLAKSIAIQCGVDYPVDIIPHAAQNGLRAFIGLRYLFPV